MSQSAQPLHTANQLVPVNRQYDMAKANMKLADFKNAFKFTIDQEEVAFSVNDLRTVLNLPQATDNNHAEFVEPLEFSTIIKFLNIFGHEFPIRLLGQFYTKHLPQPWQTLCKLLSRCLTSRITRIDQPSLTILQIFYAIINNGHVDYATLIWDGLHYQLKNPSTKNPVVLYTRYIKLITNHVLTKHHDIPKGANEPHHMIANDDFVKYMFATRNSEARGMGIPVVLLNEDIMQTNAYKVYDVDFKK
ncbi:hypothetical protein Tco_0672856, partial [Tanacetum coccineum]